MREITIILLQAGRMTDTGDDLLEALSMLEDLQDCPHTIYILKLFTVRDLKG